VLHRSIGRTVVAIPVRDEEDQIGACIAALARQSEALDDILLFLNNTVDRSATIARSMAAAFGCRLHVVEIAWPASEASAGLARKAAMDHAAELAGPQGAILTTDADGRVPPHWVARNLSHLRAGYDAVCGMAEIDPRDEAAIAPHLLADDLAETRYTTLLDEIAHVVDPCPWDPWPRHTQRSGASIAIRTAVYAAIGGVPAVRHGEDRALIEKLEDRDCKIRHDPAISVTVSGRQVGRAEGGMAATIARRMIAQDIWADDRLEAPQAALRRVRLRREARGVWSGKFDGRFLAASLQMPEAEVERVLRSPWFGAAWSAMTKASPVLRRRPIAMRQLGAACLEAERLLDDLRAARMPAVSPSSRPAGGAAGGGVWAE